MVQDRKSLAEQLIHDPFNRSSDVILTGKNRGSS